MTQNTLNSQEEQTLRTAAHGVVALLAATDPGAISSTRAGMAGGKAITSATGLVGHVLAGKADVKMKGSVAELADRVLPALSSSVEILNAKAPAETDNFRRTIDTIAQAAAEAHGGAPTPAQAETIRKISAALN